MKGQGEGWHWMDVVGCCIVTALAVASVIAPTSYLCGWREATQAIHQDAAQHGAGSYQLDRETGEVRFVWREVVEL